MAQHIEVTAAYGRTYPTLKAAKEAWAENKDFCMTHNGKYVNKSSAEYYGLNVVVRYGKNNEKVGTL